MIALVERIQALLNALKLASLNKARAFLCSATNVDAYKRFVIAVGRGDVPRLNALVSTALRNRASITTILERIKLAVNDQYHAKGYTDDDYELEYLCLTLGGRPLAELAHRTLGLPSLTTAKRHVASKAIRASPSTPTLAEMSENLDCGLSEHTVVLAAEPVVLGAQIMIDEIKVTPTLRYDPSNEMILGTCRSHSKHCVHEFRTMAQAEAIRKDLESGKIHLSTEASVIGLGFLSKNPRLYSAHPFVVSGTCKVEEIIDQKGTMERCIEAVELYASTHRLKVQVWSLATDGDSRRRRVFAMLTMIDTIEKSSPLGLVMGDMPLFDFHCGKNQLTSDCDIKHVMKRYRNTLIRQSGVSVDDVELPPKRLRTFLEPEFGKATTHNLLEPTDKQDVTLMYRLLGGIAGLQTSQHATPLEMNERRILTLLGRVYWHLLEPYTNRELSLHEQLVHLSALAHLVLSLYSSERGRFMPVQLFYDTMACIKSVYVCVAKTILVNPDGEFWIILLGTDALEKSFGTVRTIVGNDANCDTLQLSHRLGQSSRVNGIFDKHPTWAKGPRRLTLKSATIQGADTVQKTDHINPASWVGDVRVKNIVPRSPWLEGRSVAEEDLKAA
ncbi:hypothetical protein SISNIDRAFT_406124, partial [Sistotremastrum niveocremeum HHB9708]